jgi:MFS family permease
VLAPDVASTFNQRRFLAIIVLCGAGMGMTAPITVLFASSFGASPGVAGLTWSSLAISLLIVDVFGTAIVPRVDGRAMLWFALTVFGVGALLSAAAPSLPAMTAARMVQGVGAAVFMGGALQLVVRFAPPGGAGRAIGTFNAACFAGIATGPLIGGSLAALGTGQFGFRVAFLVSGVVCLVAGLAARLSLPSIPGHRPPQLRLPRRPQARAGLRIWPPLALGVFGQALRGGLEFTVIPLFGKDQLGMGTTTIGVGLSALALVDILTMRYGGMLGDRFSRRAVLCGALGVGVVGCAAAPLISGPGSFVAWCAVMGVCIGAAWVVPAAIVVDVTTEPEPALASYRICGDAGEAVGSTAIGGLFGAIGGIGAVAALGGVFALVALWVSRLAETKLAPAVDGAGADPAPPVESSVAALGNLTL